EVVLPGSLDPEPGGLRHCVTPPEMESVLDRGGGEQRRGSAHRRNPPRRAGVPAIGGRLRSPRRGLTRASARIELRDLLNFFEYGKVRSDLRQRVMEPKRIRRVQVGRHLSFVFENRDTVLLQIRRCAASNGSRTTRESRTR